MSPTQRSLALARELGRRGGWVQVELAGGAPQGRLVRARVTRSDGRRLQADPLTLTFAA